MLKSREIKSKVEIAKHILTNQPETRDDDNKLIAAFWRFEQRLITRFSSAEVFLNKLANGELSAPETITRARRLLQAEYPELRGKNKAARYEAAAEVRENIND